MKEILIISNFSNLPEEGKTDRFFYLAKILNKHKYNIKIAISSFFHTKKKMREKKINKEIIYIKEPGYKKNVCLKRFYSHFIFGRNVKKYLEEAKEKPDIVYCAVPSLTAAYYCAKFCKKNKIKYIIDIQDLWPEAFKMIFNPKYFSKIIYYPFEKVANYIYSSADIIIGVSETYTKIALEISEKTKKNVVVYLGTDLSEFDILKRRENNFKKEKNKFLITYLGTLGHSYDIKLVIDAIKLLEKKYNIKNIQFLILGDGPLKEEFEKYSEIKKVDAIFLGRLKYEEIPSLLLKSDLVVNPIKSNSAASIINKVGDYAAAGKAVINTQESLEYRGLLENYEAGINCNNIQEVVEAIFKLYVNKELREKIGENNRKLAEDLFDRQKTYKKIVDVMS